MRVFPLLLCSVSVAIRLPACARTACTAAPCRHSLRSIRLSAGGGDDAGLFGALKKAAQDAVETGEGAFRGCDAGADTRRRGP